MSQSKRLYFSDLPIGGPDRFLTYTPASETSAGDGGSGGGGTSAATRPVISPASVGPKTTSAENFAFFLPSYEGSAPILLAKDPDIALAYDSSLDRLVFVKQSTIVERKGKPHSPSLRFMLTQLLKPHQKKQVKARRRPTQ